MTGEQLALEGIIRSVEHACQVTPGWAAKAYSIFQDFIASNGSPFMMEEARDFAYAAGLPRPPAEGAWGSITRRAKREGLIRLHGFDTSKKASAHRKPSNVWVRNDPPEGEPLTCS